MRKSYRNGIIVAVVLLVLAAPLVILFTAPMWYAGLIERAARSATGLDVRIAGLQVDLFPPRIATGRLTVSNPNVAWQQPVLALEHADLSIDSQRLLDGAPTWWSAGIGGGQVSAGVDADGRDLWQTPQMASSEQKQQSGGGGAAFAFRTVQVEDFTFHRVSADGEYTLEVGDLSVQQTQDARLQVALDGHYQDEPLSAAGTVALSRTDTPRAVDFRATVFGSEVRLKGQIGSTTEPSGHLDFSADADDLTTLGLLLGQDLRRFAPVHLAVNLAQTQHDQWKLTATGTVAGRKVDIDTGIEHPGDAWSVKQLKASVGDSDVAGSASLDPSGKRLTADLSSGRFDVSSLSFAEPNNDSAPPPSGERSSTLIPAIDLKPLADWNIDTSLKVDRFDYAGYRVDGLQANAQTSAGVLTVKAAVDAATAPGGSADAWKLVAPLKLTATVTPTPADSAAAGTLVASFSTRGASGELETVLPAAAKSSAEGTLHASIDDFSAVHGIDTQSWQKFLPIKASLQASASGRTLRFTPLDISLNGNTLKGPLTIDASAKPVFISGEIESPHIDLNRIPTTSQATQDSAAKPDNTEKQDKGPVFSKEPVDWSWMNAARLNLGLDIKQFDFNKTRFHNLKTRVMLDNGELLVKPFTADLSQGGFEGHLRVMQADAGAQVDTRLLVKHLVPADLGQPDKGLIDGGNTNMFVELTTHGDSPHALAAGLDGQVAMEIQDAKVRNDLFERLGSDLLMQTLTLINPFAHRDDQTQLQCAAAHFNAVDGVLTSPGEISIVTSKMLIRGGGEIDLGKEQLQIDLAPTARKGLGISAADLASVVRLGGSLTNPKPVADPKGILKSGATIGAAIATGGVSLLAQGLVNKVTNLDTHCQSIYQDAVADAGDEGKAAK